MGNMGRNFSHGFPQIPIFPNSRGWRTGFKAKLPHQECRKAEILKSSSNLSHFVPLSFFVLSEDDLTVAPP